MFGVTHHNRVRVLCAVAANLVRARCGSANVAAVEDSG